ncbi:hypothetical protein HK100_011028 [Physocladia obscura]|uniref:Uncharacterized protein n=1 Tax=Physocladia obscura TaxID=109957 RepID=A0AAD5T1S7_9FUNG|nr:hypothetical protein HK100_011028 [Physocladia obscura]
MTKKRVALVGIGLRLPRTCRSKHEFLDLLKSDLSAISDVPTSRWNKETHVGSKQEPAKVISAKGGYIDDNEIHAFESSEYGISVAETISMDPHHKLLLTVSREAFEDAGIVYRGTSTGVFITGSSDYENLGIDDYQISEYSGTGSSLALQANRISYAFDLKGPSVFVDTACSSAMMAFHFAINSLQSGDCSQAIVGGASLLLTPRPGMAFTKLGTLSPTGACHAFDASADGYVRGEGCAVVVLKLYDDAVADGDHIYSVLSGSAINANGRGLSITMPENVAQMEVIQKAYERANRSLRDAAYVECHGTGTPVGDPIEANAIGSVIDGEQSRSPKNVDVLKIGSVKTYIGHLEWAAALAGVIKTSLMLDAELLLPSLNFETPNEKINWKRLAVQTQVEPLPASKKTNDNHFIMSVSSFGFGGANGHIVLERLARQELVPATFDEKNTPYLWMVGGLTARSSSALLTSLKERIEKKKNIDSFTLSVLSRTLNSRARGHPYVSFAVGSRPSDLTFPAPQNFPIVPPRIVLVFSGQGPQHPEMGKRLFSRFGAFKASILESNGFYCKATNQNFIQKYGLFDPSIFCSLPSAASGEWTVHAVVMSLVFFQIALFDLWKSIGIQPSSIMGHSVGEVAALYACGSITKQAAIEIALARAFALEGLKVDGGMAALGCTAKVAQELINEFLKTKESTNNETILNKLKNKANRFSGFLQLKGLWISAINSPSAVSVSGTSEYVAELVKLANKQNIFARILRVGGPYHSPLVESAKDKFIQSTAKVLGLESKPKISFISTVDGRSKDDCITGDYCWRNVREPVRFMDAIKTAFKEANSNKKSTVILEVSPHPVLQSYIEEIAQSIKISPTPLVLASAKRPNPKKGDKERTIEDAQFLTTVGELVLSGFRSINFTELAGLSGVDLVFGETDLSTALLPKYPSPKLPKELFPKEFLPSRFKRLAAPPSPLSSPLFRISTLTHPWVVGHNINNTVVFPAAGYMESAFENGAHTLRNVKFKRALILESDEAPKYVGFVKGEVEGKWSFKSSSASLFSAGMEGIACYNESGVILDQVHAEGYMTSAVSKLNAEEKDLIDNMDTYLKQFDDTASGKHFYEQVKRMNFFYTDDFKLLDHIRFSSTRSDIIFAVVTPKDDTWSKPHSAGLIFHPGILDCFFQIASLVLMPLKHTIDCYLPAEATRVSLFATKEEIRNVKSFGVFLKNRWFNGVAHSNDIYVLDLASKKIIIVFEGFEARKVPNKRNIGLEAPFTLAWEPIGIPVDVVLNGNSNDEVTTQTASIGSEIQNQMNYTARFLASSFSRRVLRILELKSESDQSILRNLSLALERIKNLHGIHFEFVTINSSALDIQENIIKLVTNDRCRLFSFDLAVVQEKAGSSMLFEWISKLLVPGGFMFTAVGQTSDAINPISSKKLCETIEFIGFELLKTTLVQDGAVILSRLSKSFMSSTLENNLSNLDSTTIVFHYNPGSEMDLVNAVKNVNGIPNVNLWVLTDNSPTGAMGISLATTIINEMDFLKVHVLVFDQEINTIKRNEYANKFQGLTTFGDLESVILVKVDGKLFSRRLVKCLAANNSVDEVLNDSKDSDWVLDIEKGKEPDIGHLLPHRQRLLPADESNLEIKIAGVSLNFKNVLSALGLLHADDKLCEFSGTVTAIGNKVTRFKIGDRVMGFTKGCREASVVVANEYACSLIPTSMNFMDACAFPIAYGTAWHSLVDLGRISPGDTVLIHSAAGGVGLAAIQIAQRFDCEIFCTVGSEGKRSFIKNQFDVLDNSISNSRSHEEWVEDSKNWLEKRGKKGFDVILSSLQGVSLQAGCSMLAPLGRFIDISKRDILSGASMSMSMFAPATSYIAVEVGILGQSKPRHLAKLLDTISATHNDKPFKYIVGHSFSGATGLLEAYRLMESGTHIGKIIVDVRTVDPNSYPGNRGIAVSKLIFDPRKSYILVGGCGGLGPRIALWMAMSGARNIVLTSRRGVLDSAGELLIRAAKFISKGEITVNVIAADATDKRAMKDVVHLAESSAPIGGVFLMTVVLADDLFVNMTEDKFKTVMNSKVTVFKNVCNALDIHKLDFLLLFSSVAVLFSNPGQSNYAAAQAYFDTIAADLPNTCSLAVPAVSDYGVFARTTQSNNAIKSFAMNAEELCDVIGEVIYRTVSGAKTRVPYYVPQLPWNIAYSNIPSLRSCASHLAVDSDDSEEEKNDLDKHDRISSLLSRLLKVEVKEIDETSNLSMLGLDSLSASRLSAILDLEFGIKLSQMQLLGSVSLATLRHILESKNNATEEMTENDMQKEGKANAAVVEQFDYMADIDLFDDASFTSIGLPLLNISKINPSESITFFLTGGTGFVGSFLLENILTVFPLSKVVCLIRAVDSESGLRRLKTKATKYGVWKDGFERRIEVIVGDLSERKFGFSSSDWANICSSIDVIIHAGSSVDWIRSYKDLRSANVAGVSEILRLATTIRLKPVQFISSVAVFFGTDAPKVVNEDYEMSQLGGKHSYGYPQTKFVAESIFKRAQDRGVPVSIIRTGLVTGHSNSGVINQEDFLFRILRGALELGIYTELPGETVLTPVDFLCESMIKLVALPQSWKNRVYHITSQESIYWRELLALGKLVTHDYIKEEMKTALLTGQTNNPLIPFAEHILAENMSVFTFSIQLNDTRLNTLPGLQVSPCKPILYVWLKNVEFVYNLIRSEGIVAKAVDIKLPLEQLMRQVSHETGLSDFGGQEFIPFANAALEDIFHPNFHIYGKLTLLRNLKGQLINRLLLFQYLKDYPDAKEIEIPLPVFIAGLPRTGSTRLHKLLALDKSAEKFKHWELHCPLTSVAVPANVQGTVNDPRVSKSTREQTLLDNLIPDLATVHDINVTEVDECYQGFIDLTLPIYLLNPELFPAAKKAQSDCEMSFVYANYKRILQVIIHQKIRAAKELNPDYVYNAKYTILKCPLHTFNLKEIKKVFPDAKLIFTQRDMRRVIPSSCSMADVTRKAFSATQNNDTTLTSAAMMAMGIRATNAISTRETVFDNSAIVDIQYVRQMKETIPTVKSAYEKLGIGFSDTFEIALQQGLAKEKETRKSGNKVLHSYSLEQYGITEEQIMQTFGAFEKKFNIEKENTRIV